MIALFADKLIISTENNSLACRCQPGPQPNRYPRAIQTSETTPCVVLRSAGKARYASYPPLVSKVASQEAVGAGGTAAFSILGDTCVITLTELLEGIGDQDDNDHGANE